VVLGIVELVQAFCRTGGGQSRNLLVKTHIQTTPTPCKNTKPIQPSSITHFTRDKPITKYKNKLLLKWVVKVGGNFYGKGEKWKMGFEKG
jgi:hypothetical protein